MTLAAQNQYEQDIRFNNILRIFAAAITGPAVMAAVLLGRLERPGGLVLVAIVVVYLVAIGACHYFALVRQKNPRLADIIGCFVDVAIMGAYIAYFGGATPAQDLVPLAHLLILVIVLFVWLNVRAPWMLVYIINSCVVGVFVASFIDASSPEPTFHFGDRVLLVATFVLFASLSLINKRHREEEIRRARAQLIQQETQIERFRLTDRHHDKLRSLGILMAGMVHEANNIIAAVSGNLHRVRNSIVVLTGLAEELDDPEGDPDQTRQELQSEIDRLKDIETNCSASMGRLSELSYDARTYSRKESALKVPSDPNDSILFALRLVEPQLRSGVQLQTELSPLPLISIEPNGICQVMVNLLINALYAAGPRGKVEVTSSVAGEEVVLKVIDNGMGIPPESRQQIFNPFFSSKPAADGTGLGLTLSRDIVASQGGVIQFGSRPGGGTIFSVHLPIRNEADLEEERDSSRMARKADGGDPGGATSGADKATS